MSESHKETVRVVSDFQSTSIDHAEAKPPGLSAVLGSCSCTSSGRRWRLWAARQSQGTDQATLVAHPLSLGARASRL